MGGYDVAQICLNGHVISEYSGSFPEGTEEFCHTCGSKTTTTCLSCGHPIRGGHDEVIGGYTVPAFCSGCGTPYPWTEARLKAARDLAEELELSEAEKTQLKESVDELVKDSPATSVSAMRFKGLVARAGKEAGTMFREILVDVVSETAKKVLWPDP